MSQAAGLAMASFCHTVDLALGGASILLADACRDRRRRLAGLLRTDGHHVIELCRESELAHAIMRRPSQADAGPVIIIAEATLASTSLGGRALARAQAKSLGAIIIMEHDESPGRDESSDGTGFSYWFRPGFDLDDLRLAVMLLNSRH